MSTFRITSLVVMFIVGAIGWLWWVCEHSPDLTKNYEDALQKWLEERRRKRPELLDDTEQGVGATSAKDSKP